MSVMTMTALTNPYIEDVLMQAEADNPHEAEFLQAVREVCSSLGPIIEQHPEYRKARILERMIEPERAIQFRVPWMDDTGTVQVNRGYRVQFSSAIGPYKGGLRFHPTVNLSILKFLGFEQIFKNALTTLPIGGGKGGSNFDPKGKSDAEVMRFCQSFMSELFRYISEDTDVPAGDIGVGGREIGFLFGQYKRLANRFTGVLTGKNMEWGGSSIRPEATGFGAVYFAAAMLEGSGDSLRGKRCLVSGSGNVAQYVVKKLNQMGAKVISMSDSDGFIIDEAGIDEAKLDWVMDLKNERRGRIVEYIEKFTTAEFTQHQPGDHNPLWTIKADCAFPCATQNEINAKDARTLVSNGIQLVCEGANMPTTLEAIEHLQDANVLYAPGKASNAGGVAVSALEMAQNSQRIQWSREEVDQRLQGIMRSIHSQCVTAAEEYGAPGNYLHGANIAAFQKVADAMLDQGLV